MKKIIPVFSVIFFLVIFCTIIFPRLNSLKTISIPSNLDIYNFEKSLFATKESQIHTDIVEWEKRTGSFFETFNLEILKIDSKDLSYKNQVLRFITNPDVREAYDTVIEKYPNVQFLEEDLAIAFSKYHEHFPKKKAPTVITYFSGFNFGVVTNDTILAIGLDFFLGKECGFYKRLDFPQYMREMHQQEFIVPFCFEAIANNEFSQFDIGPDFLSQMIYKGKVMYFLDVILPEYSNAEKLRYSKTQFDWCKKNEKKIWAYFIDQDLLYTADFKRFNSYVNNAPFAKGMPKDSPGRLAYYIGWRIVNDYMEKNPNLSLGALMQNTNSQQILQESGYKP